MSSARLVARRVLKRVEQGDAYTSLALSAELDRAGLDARDRGLATELCYGVLRHRSRIDRALNAYAKKGIQKLPPGALLALRVAAYQILFLDRIPDHAAVDDAVDEVRRVAGKLSGFANGVLRTLIRKGEPSIGEDESPESVMVRHSLPKWIVDAIVQRVGLEQLETVAAGLQTVPPLSVRVNRSRISVAQMREKLEEHGCRVTEVPEYCWALQVSGLGSPDRAPGFAEGLWAVQDVAAQLIGAMIQPGEGATILDACAGVGGKTTHLAEMLPGAQIDAVDLSARKLELLAASVARLGLTGIRPLLVDATRDDDKLRDHYDVVVLDAPCSGLGVLRRHPERKWAAQERGGNLVELQRKLIDALSKRVAPGGILLYSVCTFTAAEGPDLISDFLARHPEFTIAPPVADAAGPDWKQLLTDEGTLESWPHQNGTDAFFAVRMQRQL